MLITAWRASCLIIGWNASPAGLRARAWGCFTGSIVQGPLSTLKQELLSSRSSVPGSWNSKKIEARGRPCFRILQFDHPPLSCSTLFIPLAPPLLRLGVEFSRGWVSFQSVASMADEERGFHIGAYGASATIGTTRTVARRENSGRPEFSSPPLCVPQHYRFHKHFLSRLSSALLSSRLFPHSV